MKDVLVHLVEVLQDTRDPLSDRMRDEEIYERSLVEGGRGSRPRPPGCLDSGGPRGGAAVEWRRRAARAPAAPSMPASRVGLRSAYIGGRCVQLRYQQYMVALETAQWASIDQWNRPAGESCGTILC